MNIADFAYVVLTNKTFDEAVVAVFRQWPQEFSQKLYINYFPLCQGFLYNEIMGIDAPSSSETEDEKIEVLRAKLITAAAQDPLFSKKMISFAAKLQARYPDHGECRLYRLLIGSTPPPVCKRFDFEGEDSVEKFINENF